MRKLIKRIIVSVFCLTALCTSAFADNISNSGAAANPVTGRMNIVGTVGGAEAARTATIFILKPNAKLENINNNFDENCLYVNTVDVDYDGNYEFEFDFKPSVPTDSVLPVYIVCGDTTYDYTYNYKTWDEVKALFEKIRQGSAQYSEFEKYFDTFGIDFSKYNNEKHKNNLIGAVNKLSSITDDENGVKMLKTCVDKVKRELELLDELKACDGWFEFKSKIDEIGAYTGITFAYGSVSAESVCKALQNEIRNGKNFYSALELLSRFNELIIVNPNPTVAPSYTAPGGNGGGGAVRPSVPSYVEDPNAKFEDGKLVTSLGFNDLPQSHWAYTAVEDLFKRGFVRGVSDKTYEPDRFIKREEFVKMAVSAFGIYNAELKADFTDTDSEEWYSSYIASAKKNGLVKGVTDTEFGLGSNIKRQDMAVIIYNGLKKQGYKLSEEKVEFADEASIDDYAKTAVSSLAASGIINGMDDGCFKPHDNATRAQAAQMIYTMLRGEN